MCLALPRQLPLLRGFAPESLTLPLRGDPQLSVPGWPQIQAGYTRLGHDQEEQSVLPPTGALLGCDQ